MELSESELVSQTILPASISSNPIKKTTPMTGNIQYYEFTGLGVVGVTEEYEIGHYLKRLTAIQYSFGSTDHHKQRYIKLSYGQ